MPEVQGSRTGGDRPPQDEGAGRAIAQYIEHNFDRFLSDLRRLCRQESVSAQGRGLQEAAELLAELMRASGIEVSVHPVPGGPPVVMGEVEGRSPEALVFYNHYDVQPPEPLDAWEVPPYAAELRAGRLVARGAADNKGCLVARIQAVEALLRTRGELPITVKFVVEGEEEIGSPHLAGFLAAHRARFRAGGGLWEAGMRDRQGRPLVYLGAKGICYLELEARGSGPERHSALAPLVENPAWRLVQALSGLRDKEGRVLVPGFYDAVVLPSGEDLEMVRAIPYDPEEWRDELGLDEVPAEADSPEFFRRYLFEPTCTICGLSSGYSGPGAKTVLPSRAVAKLDFRLVPDQEPAQVEAAVRAHLAQKGFGDLLVSSHSNQEPARTPPSAAVVRAVRAAALRVYGQEPVLYPTMAGSGPLALFVKRLGVPMASVGVGHSGSGSHGPNENIRLEDYRLG
ncbi:MAG: M20/M25/M40 family metallo-hydrolase, partial [Acetobacteraceae bacterium]|nr:M20/M25/M40 family metallo-hydrolase [Acetobacteraceae bacterium]